MKALIKLLLSYLIMGAAYMAGTWLWNEVLEEKADDFVEKLRRKTAKKGA